MGSFCPVFLAFILNCLGVSMFRERQNPGCEPLVSSLIFLFAVFLLLWDIRLYPCSLRKLWACGSKFLDFCIAMFLMEHIMADFWFPLDTAMILLLPKISDWEKDLLAQGGWEGEGILQFLKNEVFCVIVSYVLSIFFLLCVLHATRMVDFRLLRCGFPTFLTDIRLRLRRFRKKLAKGFTCRRKKDNDCFCECAKLRLKAEKFLDGDECMDSDISPKKHYNKHSCPDMDCDFDMDDYDCNVNRRRRRY